MSATPNGHATVIWQPCAKPGKRTALRDVIAAWPVTWRAVRGVCPVNPLVVLRSRLCAGVGQHVSDPSSGCPERLRRTRAANAWA